MSLSYAKISKKPTIFNRLFGLSIEQFNRILANITPEWQKCVVDQYKRPGRSYKCDLADMLLILLLYYRSYITQIFVGFLFGIDDSRVCRIIQKLEPILAKEMAVTKTKHLSQEEVESLIYDATEQSIERPQKNQKSYYSGKKKRHTIKSEIGITKKGRIISVSKPRPGSMHDFTLRKHEPPIPPDSRVYVDLGYQGIDQLHQHSEFPYKKTKTKPLTIEEKEYNRALSHFRVTVEHIIGDIKTFRILSERYRNKRKRYGIKFNIIAGIVNLKNGFIVA